MSKEVTICSVGDIMICDSPLYASVGVGSRYRDKTEELFRNCKDELKNADLVIGNFETVVYDPKDRSIKEVQMCCPEDTLSVLKETGFSVLNLANNHCMQHGVDGFNNTVRVCMRNGIQPIGLMDEKPYTIEINGMRLAFIALCIHIEWYEPDHILYENRIEKVLNTVRELREGDPELQIIVSVHWGDEFATYPSNAQIALAHKLVDLGTNVILGHHPHVYQGIEEYKDAVIAYSQGNFISDMVPEMCRYNGLLKIKFTDHGKLIYDFQPYCIGTNMIPQESDDGWFEDRKNELEKALSGTVSDDDYWSMITKNHTNGHNAFKIYFKKNIGKYQLRISAKMISDFIGRKIKRIIGTSTDGRVSSMDANIYVCLDKFN